MAATARLEQPADTDPRSSDGAVLRRSLVALSVLSTVGTGLELLLLRHWDNGLELIPFASIGVLGIAIAILVWAPNRRGVWAARGIATAAAVSGAIGVFIHVRSNYEAAPLDFRYTDSWATTAEPIRWLLAATDTVGPSPTLAPAALTFAALALVAATLRHPALARIVPTSSLARSNDS